MKVVKIKPITNSCRHKSLIQKNLLSKSNKILKSLNKGSKNFSGRSATTGRITVHHKGGACKANFRNIITKNREEKAILVTNMYDPKRSSFISLNFNLDLKSFSYSLATEHALPGSILQNSISHSELKLGARTSLSNVPTGSLIHSVSLTELRTTATMARSAGTFCQLIQKSAAFCKIKLPSGALKTLPLTARATLGIVSNINNNLITFGKAGASRHRGIRPTVRGIAMNPVDHPHGGRTNGGMHWVTPWGVPTKGKKTVKR